MLPARENVRNFHHSRSFPKAVLRSRFFLRLPGAAEKLAKLYERRGDTENGVFWYRKINELLSPYNEFAGNKVQELIGSWY
jgi:hypothetical protein